MDQLSLFSTSSSAGDAVFSPCRKYRYLLWRRWADDWNSNYVMFLGLNPSTADETRDDPTIRRCIGYAKDWGFSGLCMGNIFAYRDTNPRNMLAVDDPIGPENDRYLAEYASKAGLVIAAWGNYGSHRGRDEQIKAMVPVLHCLKVTGTGMPGHPLYLLKSARPIFFSSKSLNQTSTGGLIPTAD